MGTRDFLLEIGTEEIPARMLPGGAADLQRLVLDTLKAAGLAAAGSTVFYTPRRLALMVEAVPETQDDREEVATGPAVSAAYGPDGEPTKACLGFAKGQGVDPAALVRHVGPKGEVVAVRRTVKGRPTAAVLADALPGLLARIPWPKSMRWASSTGPFVRPVHWIVALFGAEVVPFGFAGIASGRTTHGHRFLHPEPLELASPDDYEVALAEHGVKASAEERLAAIRKAMKDAETAAGCRFVPNEALLTEVSNLVETPVFGMGEFDPDFLRLPREVLITAMASHLRYFAMEDADGRLLNRFGVVSNTRARDMSVVIRGNQRVIAARLYDARFFHEVDRRNGLQAMAARLPERLFLKDVGDMAVKTGWVRAFALRIAAAAGLDDGARAVVDEAAALCKADLMSAMVGEFPELQGVMGAYYARPEGEPETPVAAAIREHYLPRFSGDALPATAPGAVLALADRLDSIWRCFKVGAIPTGSKDPLALRRAAIGALRLLAGRPELQGLTVGRVLGLIDDDAPAVRAQVTAFLADRFRGILTDDLGVPTDFANAVVDFLPDVPPAALAARARALRDFAGEATDFRDFLDNVFKRVGNILKQADDKVPGWRDDADARGWLATDADFGDALGHDVEKAVEATRQAALGAYHAARESGAHRDLLAAMYSFKDPLARFFGTGRDGVPVLIEEDTEKRTARIALLHRVFALFSWYADFSKISTR